MGRRKTIRKKKRGTSNSNFKY